MKISELNSLLRGGEGNNKGGDMNITETRKYAEDNNEVGLTPDELDHVAMCMATMNMILTTENVVILISTLRNQTIAQVTSQ